MLSKATAQLVAEVMGYFGEDNKIKAEKDPEACLVAMLTLIEKDLSDVSSMLSFTVQFATYDDYLKEARKKIEQSK